MPLSFRRAPPSVGVELPPIQQVAQSQNGILELQSSSIKELPWMPSCCHWQRNRRIDYPKETGYSVGESLQTLGYAGIYPIVSASVSRMRPARKAETIARECHPMKGSTFASAKGL